MKRGRKWGIGCGGFVVLLAILAIAFPAQRKALFTALKIYREQSAYNQQHDYSGTSIDNLRHIQAALSEYSDSEGALPAADHWMDSAEKYLQTNDLNKGEYKKKLIRPDLLGQTGQFGYAMNDACSSKYIGTKDNGFKGDVPDPSKTPLIFESTATDRNAHGDPTKLRHGLAITIDGTILTK